MHLCQSYFKLLVQTQINGLVFLFATSCRAGGEIAPGRRGDGVIRAPFTRPAPHGAGLSCQAIARATGHVGRVGPLRGPKEQRAWKWYFWNQHIKGGHHLPPF